MAEVLAVEARNAVKEFGTGPAVVTDGEKHVVPEAINLAGVAAEEERSELIAHDGFARVGGGVGFAETDETVVGVDTDPEPTDLPGVDGDSQTHTVNRFEVGGKQGRPGFGLLESCKVHADHAAAILPLIRRRHRQCEVPRNVRAVAAVLPRGDDDEVHMTTWLRRPAGDLWLNRRG